MASVPPEWELHTPPTAAHFRRLYDKHQLVLIRGASSPSSAMGGWWADPLVQLRSAFDAAPKMVAGTWTCENGMKRDADEVLGRPAPRKRRRAEAEDERWYASFVVQPSGGTAQLDAFLATMPLAELPACFASSRAARASSAPSARDAVAHANAVWVFFGRVAGREPLPGRPEHTDAVEHDGTWHLQCAGRKVWHLRPTDALVARWRGGGGGDSGGGGGGCGGGGCSSEALHPPPPPPPPPSSSGWQELFDEKGNAYYYHPQSGVSQWERPGGGPASQWEPAAAVPQAGYDGACYGGEAGGGATGGEAGGGGERQQQDQLFHTLEAQFERSRRMQFGGGRGSRGGF
jgi:hypothetical protein